MASYAGKEPLHSVRNFLRRKFGLLAATPSDRREFRRIMGFVPELASYRYGGFAHVKDLAEERGFEKISDYRAAIESNPEELGHLKENVTLKGTHFFRDGRGWKTLRDLCLPKLSERGDVRVWCAGCSSGEEAYSLVLALAEFVPLDSVSVLATDYNEGLLERCREGSYSVLRLHEIPECFIEAVRMCEGERRFTFSDDILKAVRVERLDLLKDEFPGGFDLISCRNVIKFFSGASRREVQRKLSESLAVGGFLFLATDNSGGLVERIPFPGRLGLRRIGHTNIYQRVG